MGNWKRNLEVGLCSIIRASKRGKILTAWQRRKLPKDFRWRLYSKIMGNAWERYHDAMYAEYVKRFGEPKKAE